MSWLDLDMYDCMKPTGRKKTIPEAIVGTIGWLSVIGFLTLVIFTSLVILWRLFV